jgi:transposase InsO family protein
MHQGMPWMEQRTMRLKLDFVVRALKRDVRMSALCKQFGISRETGYKWLNRYKKLGPDGLEDLSRRPTSAPLATAEDMVLDVLEFRDAHPRWGPKKLRVMLERKHGAQAPSVATIARILRRFGLVRERRYFRHLSIIEAAPSVHPEACNDVWTVDFKGWWRVRNGQRCEPLTVRDGFSRYILAIKVMSGTSLEETRLVFQGLFRRYGVPKVIQCDNGTPFIHVQSRGGLTRLSAWWVSLGISVVRSRLASPQDNGAHERMHVDVKADLQLHPSATLFAEQRACDRWRQEFNHVRPHEALKGKVPADFYRPSERRARHRHFLYPSDWVVRTVGRNGQIKIQDQWYTAGKALVGFRVALEPVKDLTHRLRFGDLDLGEIKLVVPDRVIDKVARAYLSQSRTAA